MAKGYIIEINTRWAHKSIGDKLHAIYLNPTTAIEHAQEIVDEENGFVQENNTRIRKQRLKLGIIDEDEFDMHTLLTEKPVIQFHQTGHIVYKQWKDDSGWEPSFVRILEFNLI